jgi:RHS repeat-associated protein
LTDPVFGRIWLEAQGAQTTAVYTYGNALVRKDEEYPLFDGLGSERTVTNASQTVTGTINYDAFGQTVGTTGSSTNPYMFAATWGYRNDGDAGLMHVGARYYDAEGGRFITRDTVLSEHPYLYCEHEPVSRVDPSGDEALEYLANEIWKSPIAKMGTIGTIGGLVEEYTPPGTVAHGIGATLAGGAITVTGIGMVAAGAIASAPVVIVGVTIAGTFVSVVGVVHIIRGWFE